MKASGEKEKNDKVESKWAPQEKYPPHIKMEEAEIKNADSKSRKLNSCQMNEHRQMDLLSSCRQRAMRADSFAASGHIDPNDVYVDAAQSECYGR